MDRQPLVKPAAPNDVWSADFVFDRTAEGRVLKCLTIVDDATTEAVAIIPARALGGPAVTRALDRLGTTRGLPRILRTDNGPEFCGRVMLTWAHERQVTLRLIEPGKPTQNASIESFNGRFRDECLNEHWFTSVAHAEAVIEAWRREYTEERPKKGLGGLTPAGFARQLQSKAGTVTAGLSSRLLLRTAGRQAARPRGLLDRQFVATRPSRLRVSDFTDVATWGGFVVVAFGINVFARRIVGWRVSASMRTDFVLDALEHAIHARGHDALTGLVHHSGQRVQYLAALHRPPRRRRIAPPVGSCADVHGEVFAESMIGLFRTEVIQRKGPWWKAI